MFCPAGMTPWISPGGMPASQSRGTLMFWLKKSSIHRRMDNSFLRLAFEDGATAFKQACDGECSLREGIILPALVLDVRTSSGSAAAARIQDDGSQIAFVRVASADGGFTVPASTSGLRGPTPQPGHLVAWQADRYDRNLAKLAPATKRRFGWIGVRDKRCGWIGVIKGTLRLIYEDDGWIGDKRFRVLTEIAAPRRTHALDSSLSIRPATASRKPLFTDLIATR
jgi:hypothetical protein